MTEELPKVRTFEGDIAETIKDNRASVASVALAQEKKRNAYEESGEEKPPHSKTKLFLLTGTFFILVSIGLIAFGLYKEKAGDDISKEEELTTSLIQFDAIERITFDENEVRSVAVKKVQAAVPEKIPGDITKVRLYEKKGTSTEEVLTSSFAKRFLGKVPNILVRSVAESFDYAVYQDTKERKPFFVFSVLDYERTYAGLLTWERTLFEDAAELFYKERLKPDAEKPLFKDVIVKNDELRILQGVDGVEYLVYGFSGQNRLILAFDTETFFIAKEMLRK